MNITVMFPKAAKDKENFGKIKNEQNTPLRLNANMQNWLSSSHA